MEYLVIGRFNFFSEPKRDLLTDRVDCVGRAYLQYLVISLCFVTTGNIYLMKLDDACFISRRKLHIAAAAIRDKNIIK